MEQASTKGENLATNKMISSRLKQWPSQLILMVVFAIALIISACDTAADERYVPFRVESQGRLSSSWGRHIPGFPPVILQSVYESHNFHHFLQDLLRNKNDILLNEKFDEAFFEERALLIVTGRPVSMSIRHVIKNVSLVEGELVVELHEDTTHIGSDSSTPYFVVNIHNSLYSDEIVIVYSNCRCPHCVYGGLLHKWLKPMQQPQIT